MNTATAPAPVSPPSTSAHDAEHAARSQSLSRGDLGMALLHLERAHQGISTWETAHAWLTAATRHGVLASDEASLFVGAPAVAFALHTAADGTDRYAGALRVLDTSITTLTRRRLDHAHARIDGGEQPKAAEFDLFYGLTGLGSYLLRRDPHSKILHDVLSYLVRLTEPLPADGEHLPGWWTHHGPTTGTSKAFPGGHGNAGMAHGITGPLALLSLASRHGITVDGHPQAMTRICTWLDAQRQEADTGPWWPRWISLTEHRSRTVSQPGPSQPSWCYGTPGIARAQQLAGIALEDPARQHMAEAALLRCLSDPRRQRPGRTAGRIRRGAR